EALPEGVVAGRAVKVVDARAEAKRTRPPRRFTDASLLTAMETAGRTLDDRELAEAMRETGLGTPATRAEIIETLVRREYVARQGRSLAATEKGIRLVERVHPHVKSPALTAEWEAQLARIQEKNDDLAAFMARIEAHVRALVAATLGTPPPGAPTPPLGAPTPPPAAPTSPRPPPVPPVSLQSSPPRAHASARTVRDVVRPDGRPLPPPAPAAASSPSAPLGEKLLTLLRSTFRLESFRPRQEVVCRAVAEGR